MKEDAKRLAEFLDECRPEYRDGKWRFQIELERLHELLHTEDAYRALTEAALPRVGRGAGGAVVLLRLGQFLNLMERQRRPALIIDTEN